MKNFFQNYIKKYSRKIATIGMMAVFTLIVLVPTTAKAGPAEDACRTGGNNAAFLACVNAYNTNLAQKNAAPAAAANVNQNPTPSTPASGGGFIQEIGLGALDSILVFVGQSIITILSLFLGLAGFILDYIIKYTITELALHINGITGINVAWRLIRDLCNMSFIFILVYYGIMMIFGQADARKIIAPIIIAAVLINFSLFFTKIMIDASNVVAVSFYNSIISGNTTGVSVQVASGANTINADAGSISGAFMKDLHIAGIFDKGGFDAATLNSNAINVFTSLFGGSILILIATFCFMGMAVLFGIRYLTFIILLIISPVGYVSSAIPGLKKYSKQYWEALAGQAYFAPIFMIMTWITLTIAGSAGFLTEGTTGSLGVVFSGQTPKADTIGLLLNYAIIIGLMIATMKMSKDTATKGALISSKVVGQATSFAGGALFGGAAAIGRGTLGARANSASNNEDLKQKAAEGNKWAQLKLKTYRGVAGSTFDARGTSTFGTLSKTTGLDLGKAGGKGGYKKAVEEKAKKEMEYAKSLKPSDEFTESAKKQLESEEFKKTEETKKKDNTQAIQNQKDADINEQKIILKATTDAQEPIKKEKEKLEKDIRDKETVIKNLKDQIEFHGDSVDKDALQRDVDKLEQEKKISEESLQVKQKEYTDKEKIIKEGNAKIADIEAEAKAKIDMYMSPEKEDLIAKKGGQKEEVYTKKEATDLGLDIAGKTKTKAVTSLANQRVTDYADHLDNKSAAVTGYESGEIFGKKITVPFAWAGRTQYGNPQLNKAAAGKVRSLNKEKSTDEMLKEITKKQRKEAKERGERDPDDEDLGTPAAPATPPPATPPTP